MKIAHFRTLLAALLVALPVPALAQEQDAGPAMEGLDHAAMGHEAADAGPAPEAAAAPEAAPAEAPPAEHAGHHGHHGHETTAPLGLSHGREASGTSWQPDLTPVYAVHIMEGDWMFMFHGMLHVGLVDMVGPRGDTSLFSTNWVMLMASRALAGGQLELRTMLSAEPVTVPDEGYPLLLQTGETFNGRVLHDRQHPHDLFMELAARYRREVVSGVAAELYVAPVGEPAIGPTAYPHRESAALSMLAPISHHHLDSTHVTFGVVTADVYTRYFKVEGSAFNGREPDEERFDFDFAPIDSYAVRAQVAPLPELVAQVSYAYLGQPEAQKPGVSQRRLTASATWDRRLGEAGNLAATVAWGLTREGEETTNAVLGEVNADLDGANSVFGRLEWVEREPEELDVPESLGGPFSVWSASLGAMHELAAVDGVRLGFGALGMLAFVPEPLNPFYGGDAAPGVLAFARLRLVGSGGH